MKEVLKIIVALIPVAKALHKKIKDVKDKHEVKKILDSVDPDELTAIIVGDKRV